MLLIRYGTIGPQLRSWQSYARNCEKKVTKLNPRDIFIAVIFTCHPKEYKGVSNNINNPQLALILQSSAIKTLQKITRSMHPLCHSTIAPH